MVRSLDGNIEGVWEKIKLQQDPIRSRAGITAKKAVWLVCDPGDSVDADAEPSSILESVWPEGAPRGSCRFSVDLRQCMNGEYDKCTYITRFTPTLAMEAEEKAEAIDPTNANDKGVSKAGTKVTQQTKRARSDCEVPSTDPKKSRINAADEIKNAEGEDDFVISLPQPDETCDDYDYSEAFEFLDECTDNNNEELWSGADFDNSESSDKRQEKNDEERQRNRNTTSRLMSASAGLRDHCQKNPDTWKNLMRHKKNISDRQASIEHEIDQVVQNIDQLNNTLNNLQRESGENAELLEDLRALGSYHNNTMTQLDSLRRTLDSFDQS